MTGVRTSFVASAGRANLCSVCWRFIGEIFTRLCGDEIKEHCLDVNKRFRDTGGALVCLSVLCQKRVVKICIEKRFPTAITLVSQSYTKYYLCRSLTFSGACIKGNYYKPRAHLKEIASCGQPNHKTFWTGKYDTR